MRLRCIAAARSFDASSYLPFYIDTQRVGWIRPTDAPSLARWREVFDIDTSRVLLRSSCASNDSVQTRSEALAVVIRALADEGRIRGWRNETYAIRNAFDDAPLAFIERAAARFFGTMTYAVHLNGLVSYPDRAPQLWIARRSATKATDPLMLDNVVAGGIGWGFDIRSTMINECWEEAGIAPELAQCAAPGRTFYVLRSIPEGAQAEQVFVYDLSLADGFTPANQDGEVGEHRLSTIDEVLAWIEQGAMTVDASLATLDCLLRHRLIESEACAGMDALFEPLVRGGGVS